MLFCCLSIHSLPCSLSGICARCYRHPRGCGGDQVLHARQGGELTDLQQAHGERWVLGGLCGAVLGAARPRHCLAACRSCPGAHRVACSCFHWVPRSWWKLHTLNVLNSGMGQTFSPGYCSFLVDLSKQRKWNRMWITLGFRGGFSQEGNMFSFLQREAVQEWEEGGKHCKHKVGWSGL